MFATPNEMGQALDDVLSFPGRVDFWFEGAVAEEIYHVDNPIYRIRLRNGACFESHDPDETLQQANNYCMATYRLTGETP